MHFIKALLKKAWVKWLLVIVAIPLLYGQYFLVLQWNTNFHAVVEGELYRSAQPTAEDIHEYVDEYGIKTIVNLRGHNPERVWYQDEIQAAKEAGVQHINFKLSAKRELTDQQLDELVALLRDAPKPVLVHCHSGSDRSGLAGALYLFALKNMPADEAKWQLSMVYGHIPYDILPWYAMTKSFWRAVDRGFQQVDESNSDVPDALPAQ